MKLVLAITLLALSGCVDRGRCLDERMEFVMVPQVIMVKPVIVTQRVQPVTTCFKWEFPEGRKR